ncbi:MAG: YbaY family lipoprotein [SAR202 cluster bacterium]|nr:YbaY family lipoprotein [SAR202 cluster bacterium]MDP6799483.1 YbaY family lipoprotein [SAR202 cluster bacterium]
MPMSEFPAAHVRNRLALAISLAAMCMVILGPTRVPIAVAQTPGADLAFESTFDADADGWTAGFADLPADFNQDSYELDSGFRALPEGLAGNGFYIQGHNRSDDLFMYLTRYVGGFQPSTEYRMTTEIDFATNVPGGSFGIGGSPGESVYVKAGATAVEPTQAQDASGWLRSNVDKGNQSNSGGAMVVVGNVSHPDVVGDEYRIKTVTNADSPLSVTTDADGGLWLIVGTDSGFEGLTALYYSRISYSFVAESAPATASITGTITYREKIALTPNAVIEVKLIDVSRADAPAVTIAEKIIEEPGQVPVSFEIEYDPADIDERFTYAVQARITESGELAFINDTTYGVITRDSPTHVDMVLVQVNPLEPSTPPDVGGSSLPGWLLFAVATVGAFLIVLGARSLSAAVPKR